MVRYFFKTQKLKIMKKTLLTLGLLSLSLPAFAQSVSHVGDGGVFFIGENALLYNGGGLQTQGSGQYDIHGNVMVVGSGSDAVKTLNVSGTTNKTNGGNIILRYNDFTDAETSTFGQLFINGLAQTNLTGIVDKEYIATNHGTYQQLALPFYKKSLRTLDGELAKVFTNVRRSKNEILVWDNAGVEADFFNIGGTTIKGTEYYMIGGKDINFARPAISVTGNPLTPPGTVFTLRGMPYANGFTEKLTNAGASVTFGSTGQGRNSYSETYNSYVQDAWDATMLPEIANAYAVPTYGKNIYQFGNPYFTNIDIRSIGIVESTISDGNQIAGIRGIRVDPGGVVSDSQGATYSSNARFVNFGPGTNVPAGDVGLMIRSMGTFVVKLRNNDAEVGNDRTLSFDGLRRFKYKSRFSGNYGVTAAKGVSAGTLKQLGILALDKDGNELSRAYYVVYPQATSGHTTNETVQSTLGSQNIIGTYEEDAVKGGYDDKLKNSYWLYINEANEVDFEGKGIPLALYSDDIKSLKFEIRENAELVEDKVHELSTGIGFFYKGKNGEEVRIAQNQTIPVAGNEHMLYFGKPSSTLGTDVAVNPSRTRIVYNSNNDRYLIQFDPKWKTANVQVFDMSGKLVISKNNVLANEDFYIDLARSNSGYIVTAVSDSGEKVSSKIIR